MSYGLENVTPDLLPHRARKTQDKRECEVAERTERVKGSGQGEKKKPLEAKRGQGRDKSLFM